MTKFLIVLFFLTGFETFAQEEAQQHNFSIHAGFNGGLLSGGFGPSFSVHYAIRKQKVIQLESMLFYDSHSGSTFLSGFDQKNTGLGSTVGVRINMRPHKNWNPSFILTGGAMYSSEVTSQPYESKGMSGAVAMGISNTFQQQHMVTIGYHSGRNIASLVIKYGFWF